MRLNLKTLYSRLFLGYTTNDAEKYAIENSFREDY